MPPGPTPTPIPVVPPTPTAIRLTATTKSASAIDLSWNAEAIQGKLYRSTQNGFAAADGTFLGDFDSDSYTFADSGLAPETIYYYLFVPGSSAYSEGRNSAETDPLPAPSLTLAPSPNFPDSIVAGGGASEVTATYSGSATNAGHTVAFSYRYSDAASFSEPVNVTTEADGTAKFPVTLGASTGKIVVKATCEGQEKETTITVGKPEGNVNVVKPSLIADGQDSTNIELHLTYNGQNVSGHSISWRISHVENAQGQTVTPDENGNYNYLDYGVLTEVINNGSNETNTTKSNGLSIVRYTTGTLPGTITFEATDNSVILNDVQAAPLIGHMSQGGTPNLAAGAAPSKAPTFDNKAQQKPKTTVPADYSITSLNVGGAFSLEKDVGAPLETKFYYAVKSAEAGDDIVLTASIEKNGQYVSSADLPQGYLKWSEGAPVEGEP